MCLKLSSVKPLKKSPEKEIINVLQLKDVDAGQTMEENKKLTHLFCRRGFCAVTFVNVPRKCQA